MLVIPSFHVTALKKTLALKLLASEMFLNIDLLVDADSFILN